MIYVFAILVFLFLVLWISEMFLDIDEDYDERKSYEHYKSYH